MVDKTMRQIQQHGERLFPIAAYKYSRPDYAKLLECHWHEEWEFFLVDSGHVRFTADGSIIDLEAGDMVFLPSGKLHMAEGVWKPPYNYRAVVFNPGMLYGLCDAAHTKYIAPVLSGTIGAQIIRRKDCDAARQIFGKLVNVLVNRPVMFEILTKAYLYELVAVTFAHSKLWLVKEYRELPAEAAIKKALSYIQKHLEDRIMVADLAQLAGMSEGHFTRLFKNYTSRTPIDYIVCTRLIKASELIAETDEKLICVAMNLGFNSVSYFSRAFKSYFGCSPSQYRSKASEASTARAG